MKKIMKEDFPIMSHSIERDYKERYRSFSHLTLPFLVYISLNIKMLGVVLLNAKMF